MERVVLHSKYEQRQLPSHQRMGKQKMRSDLTATEGATSVAEIRAVPRFLLQLLQRFKRRVRWWAVQLNPLWMELRRIE